MKIYVEMDDKQYEVFKGVLDGEYEKKENASNIDSFLRGKKGFRIIDSEIECNTNFERFRITKYIKDSSVVIVKEKLINGKNEVERN